MNNPVKGRGGFPALLAAVALLVFSLDQASKYWIAHSGLPYGAYPPHGGIEVIPGFFSIVYNTNAGAAWGILSGHRAILVLTGIAAIAAIFVFRKSLGIRGRFMQALFGLIVGGISGNLLDRALFGSVTDFLDLHLGGLYRWPTFNVADSAMVVGVALYVIASLFHREAPEGSGGENAGESRQNGSEPPHLAD
jgi:signal peptidase II